VIRSDAMTTGRPADARSAGAFSLIELLVVVSILAIVMALITPAVNALKGGNDVTSAAFEISGLLQQARTFAITNNTYVWVGFYEEDAEATTPTNDTPPYDGKGKVVIAVIASKDGTTIVDDNASGTVALDPARFYAVSKLVNIAGIHLTDIGAPPATPPTSARSDSLDVRSGLPYSTSQDPQTKRNRISSDSDVDTVRPFTALGYTFYKTIRFSPRGEANLNSTYRPRRVAEIGLRPTRGSVVDLNTPNVAAVQLTGIGGRVNIYRR
jgi:prepilin-type N-terminal cleavage/methylation domain-containing protein